MGIFSKKDKTPSSAGRSQAGPSNSVLLFSGPYLRELLTPDVCLRALEEMYSNLHRSPSDKGQALGFETGDGVIHVKAGLAPRVHDYFAAKVNANYPNNAKAHGLPTIQGLIVLSECKTGAPVAILQSGVLTGVRTAAATALATKYGARQDAKTLAIIGCGEQSTYQAEAVLGVRSISDIVVCDAINERAATFQQWVRKSLRVDVSVEPDIAEAVRVCDICVTATTSRTPIVTADMVPEGCFIAAVGADNSDKQEIDPALFESARIIVDDADQCAKSGDLAHAIRAGIVSKEDIDATLAELTAGARTGRTSDSEIVIFDSTGVGVQDVAASTAVYALAVTSGAGQRFDF